jgi:nucleotide-binding universal stress UspA family protein
MSEGRSPRFERILCPVDFSETSRHAVDHATAIARWYGASITALHVYPRLVPMRDLPMREEPVPESEIAPLRAEAAAAFGPATAAGIAVTVIVDAGQPAPRILERAATLPADLIVMGTHGTSGFEHLLLGSVTEKVLRKARCPVLTVPPRAPGSSALPFGRVLCAVDFSPASIAGLHAAFSIARQSGAALSLVHVVDWPWEEPPRPSYEDLPPAQAAALADFRRYLHTTALARLDSLVPPSERERGMPTLRVSHGKPYVEILRTAEDDRADLIVIGVGGRSAADLTIFGSTTNQVVRRARCPVLTLRG